MSKEPAMADAKEMPTVVCLMGPTASGKTGLAMALAKQIPVEIISVDSALVYRGLDIGSAKPDAEMLAAVPHHLIDIRDPSEPYSAADFRADVIRLVPEILNRGKLPLLVGGTMLYFKALKEGLAKLPPADSKVRLEISLMAGEHGWPYIHGLLAEVDPVAAERINPNDPQRLQRAYEVYKVSGRSLTDWQADPVEPCPFRLFEMAVIPPDRSQLHQLIAGRFQEMLDLGLMGEVQTLYQRHDLDPSLPAIRSVGYRQAWAYLDGELDYETMVEKAVIATRQLAKRQFTWLRSWSDLNILTAPDVNEALKILRADSILANVVSPKDH